MEYTKYSGKAKHRRGRRGCQKDKRILAQPRKLILARFSPIIDLKTRSRARQSRVKPRAEKLAYMHIPICVYLHTSIFIIYNSFRRKLKKREEYRLTINHWQLTSTDLRLAGQAAPHPLSFTRLVYRRRVGSVAEATRWGVRRIGRGRCCAKCLIRRDAAVKQTKDQPARGQNEAASTGKQTRWRSPRKMKGTQAG